MVAEYPEYPPASGMLAFVLLFSGHMGWSAPSPPARQRAAALACRAVGRDCQDGWTHIALGYAHSLARQREQAVREFDNAIDLNPNFAAAYGWRGFTLAHAGVVPDGIADSEFAVRLSPRDPQNAIFSTAIGVAHYLDGRYVEAEAAAAEGVRLRPGFLGGHRVRCAALARMGRVAEARTVLAYVLERQPGLSASVLRASLPYSTPEGLETFIEGLSLAGMAP